MRNLINNKGFTLIELLVVIVIISVLSALLMANFAGIRERVRDAQRKSDLRQIASALEMYRADLGYYPLTSAFEDCGSDVQFDNGDSTIYMQKIPCDPIDKTTSYSYSPTPTNCTNDPDNSCTGYTIYTCLENLNDSEKDTTNLCSGERTSFTLTNP